MLSVPFTFSAHNWWPDIVVARQFSRGNRKPEAWSPAGKNVATRKSTARQGSSVYADLNANSLVCGGPSSLVFLSPRTGRSTRSHTTKLIARAAGTRTQLNEIGIVWGFFCFSFRYRFSCFRENPIYMRTYTASLQICSLILLTVWMMLVECAVISRCRWS